MRHRKKTVKLGRKPAHTRAMIAGLVCSLIERKRIKTTIVKAKVARSMAEKMVTLGKKGTLATRRKAVAELHQPKTVKILFDTVAPAFMDRQGGYTRIVRLGRRSSDSSEMAILEWVNYVSEEPKKGASEKKESSVKETKKPAKKPSEKKVEKKTEKKPAKKPVKKAKEEK